MSIRPLHPDIHVLLITVLYKHTLIDNSTVVYNTFTNELLGIVSLYKYNYTLINTGNTNNTTYTNNTNNTTNTNNINNTTNTNNSNNTNNGIYRNTRRYDYVYIICI